MLPTTEDREDLASAHRGAQEEEVVQLLHEQQQIVVTTDAVSEDGDAATDATSAQEAERCREPTSVSEAGGAQDTQGHRAESVGVGVASGVSAQAGWDLALLFGFPWP